ncbi:MAG: DUF2298 domain-containing protein, partial [Dehalococcoidia bacterium]|nr:DUF2298 domain-containing protein [Dehalococcoidia bacterium]
NVAIGIVVAATAFYALAYMNVYSLPHPAVRMGEWINANVPKGALILKEHWEEGIPNLGAYRGGDLNLYENDDANKLNHIVTQVRSGDYIVFFSNRLYGTIPRLPERYPLTSRYYDLLFKGELGYELVDVETAYPSLLGVTIIDETFGRPNLSVPKMLAGFQPTAITIDGGFADESFTVYDHPKVMLFKKVKQFSDQELRGLFANISLNRPPPDLSTSPGLLLSEADARANQEGGTWSDIFDRDGIANSFPALSWLIMVEVISLAALPLGVLLFRRLADRGFILTKILGILVVSYLSWLFAATHLLTFSRLTILLSLIVMALFSTYLFVRFRQEIEAFVRSRWRLLVGLEGLFLLAFFGFYLVRLANPDLWHAWRGGEKPMDFAYLNAVIKTTYFPPYDPWFSGGYLNYYYFGQVIVATLTKLVGIVPAVAYNLALPLLFSLTLSGAFSLGYDLRLAGKGQGSKSGWRWSALLCGLLAAAMVAVLGNLDGIIQLAEGLARAGSFDFQSTIPALAGAVNATVGLWRSLVDHQPLPAFDFWRSSRMMPGTINITEFPYFTFLFADLHAHLIALPFTILAIGLALNMALRSRSSGTDRTLESGLASSSAGNGSPLFVPGYLGRLPGVFFSLISWLSPALPLPRLFPVLALALALGALRIINSWDFPTYLLLSVAAIFIGEYSSRGGIGFRTVSMFVIKAGLIFWLSSFLYQPFYDKYELFYTGIEPSQEKTVIENYLAVHGLFLFAVISYLVLEMRRRFGRSGFLRTVLLVSRRWEDLPHVIGLRRRLVKKPDPDSATVAYGLMLVLLVAAGLALAKLYLIALLFLVLAMAVSLAFGELAKREAGMSPRLFVLTMVGFAIALGIGVDFITIKGDVSRMNTVFKFYLQAWVLFSLASAYGLVAVLDGLLGVGRQRNRAADKRMALLAIDPDPAVRVHGYLGQTTPFDESVGAVPPCPPPSPHPYRKDGGTAISKKIAITSWKAAWLVVLAVLLLSTAIYPLAATRVRVEDRFQSSPPTDDGMAFMKDAIYSDEKGKVTLGDDYEAITWMQDNLKGSPVIVEAYTPLYRWGSRVSIYTGLPTVIGWDWHQTQQRMPYRSMIDIRMKDVKDIYLSPDARLTMDLLKKYGIKYIYVGELERLYFGGPGLAKFDQMAKTDLTLVHENQAVKIYEVRQN